jgi:hypothetical protein
LNLKGAPYKFKGQPYKKARIWVILTEFWVFGGEGRLLGAKLGFLRVRHGCVTTALLPPLQNNFLYRNEGLRHYAVKPF